MHRIAQVELRVVRLPLTRPFTTSSHTKTHLDHILVHVTDRDGAEGWGECASPSDPYYCSETVETCWHILRDFVVPAVLDRPWSTPDEAAELWTRIRGNHFAKAGIEMACWDLYTRARGISLASALGGVQAEIRSGVSLGLEGTIVELVEQVDRYVGEGYQRVKLKVAPGRDVRYVSAVRDRFAGLPLMVDANSAYSLDEPKHVEALKALDSCGLTMIEQPLADDDIVDHARLQAQLKTPICLDESIRSAADARKAIELGSCRIVNIKVSRLGGLSEARRTHGVCAERGVAVWCGGMHEFGIGRAANVAINSLPGFTLPGDVSGSDKAYVRDLVSPPIRAKNGKVAVPFDRPGLGVEPDLPLIISSTLRVWTADAASA